jgi:hypothetical protein
MTMRTTGLSTVRVRSKDLRWLAAAPLLIAFSLFSNESLAAPAGPAATPKRKPPAKAAVEPAKCTAPDTTLDPQGPPEDFYKRGQCDEVGGHLVSALDLYQLALRKQPSAPLAKALQARIGFLIPQLSALRFETGGWPPGTRIRVGDKSIEVVAPGLRATREWVDPGRIEVVAEAPGYQKAKQFVDVGKGEEKAVSFGPPTPMPADATPPVVATSGPPAPLIIEGPARTTPVHEGGSILRPMGYVSLAVGGAALIAGGITGYLAYNNGRTVLAQCATPTTCTPGGAAAARLGGSFSTISTLTVISGGALTLCALALIYLGGPKGKVVARYIQSGGAL